MNKKIALSILLIITIISVFFIISLSVFAEGTTDDPIITTAPPTSTAVTTDTNTVEPTTKPSVEPTTKPSVEPSNDQNTDNKPTATPNTGNNEINKDDVVKSTPNTVTVKTVTAVSNVKATTATEELPKTGEGDSISFIVGGIILVLSGAGVLIYRKKLLQ